MLITYPKENSFYIKKVVPIIFLFIIIFTGISIAMFLNISESSYIIYSIWIIALVIFYFILPKNKSTLFNE
tara:strand:+ start:631 stop:843 length:213 start_codon:yes stop_codon:yes gene_type:complete